MEEDCNVAETMQNTHLRGAMYGVPLYYLHMTCQLANSGCLLKVLLALAQPGPYHCRFYKLKQQQRRLLVKCHAGLARTTGILRGRQHCGGEATRPWCCTSCSACTRGTQSGTAPQTGGCSRCTAPSACAPRTPGAAAPTPLGRPTSGSTRACRPWIWRRWGTCSCSACTPVRGCRQEQSMFNRWL